MNINIDRWTNQNIYKIHAHLSDEFLQINQTPILNISREINIPIVCTFLFSVAWLTDVPTRTKKDAHWLDESSQQQKTSKLNHVSSIFFRIIIDENL